MQYRKLCCCLSNGILVEPFYSPCVKHSNSTMINIKLQAISAIFFITLQCLFFVIQDFVRRILANMFHCHGQCLPVLFYRQAHSFSVIQQQQQQELFFFIDFSLCLQHDVPQKHCQKKGTTAKTSHTLDISAHPSTRDTQQE